MSNINYTTNLSKYINDIKWIKHHLIIGIEAALIDIKKKLIFDIDENNNVEFPANVSINGDSNNYSLTKLFENVQHINQQLGNIENLSEIQEIMNNLNSIEHSIRRLENKAKGFERDGYESKTNVNDKVEFKNDIVLGSDKMSNASIIGYGGVFGLNSSVQIKRVRYEKVNYWKPPTPDNNNYNQLFMIELLKGVINGNNLEYNINMTLDYKVLNGMNINYEMYLVSKDGQCVSNSTGTTLIVKLDDASDFICGAFEKDGVSYDQKVYAYDKDSVITFHTNGIKYNPTTGLTISNHPVFTIQNKVLNILNQNEETGTSKLTFIPKTCLNAYVDSSGPTAKQKDEFVKEYNISDSNIWNNVINNGVNVSNYPNESTNITFKEGVKLMSNNVSNPIVEIDDNGLNVKLVSGDEQKDTMNLTTEGLKVNSLILKTDETIEPQIKVVDKIFDFNNDAQFTFKKEDETKTIKISEIEDIHSQKIHELENRIITLERSAWFVDSSMVDNNIFNQDSLSDENVKNRFNNIENPVYHVDE